MLTAIAAAPCRIRSVAELEHEYQRARTVYRMRLAAGDIAEAMVHLANMMRLYRSIRWAQDLQRRRLGVRIDRLAPSSLGPALPPGTWQPSEGGLS